MADAAAKPVAEDAVEDISRPKEVIRRMYGLMESGLMSDVQFDVPLSLPRVEGKSERIKAHRCVYAVASPHFRDILDTGAAETEEAGVVKIDDADVATFKKVMRFLYTGEISLNNSEAASILPLSAAWKMQGLRSACELTMGKHISVPTVCESLASAFECGADELRDRCLFFIARNGTKVLAGDDFLTLPKECVKMIVANGDLMVATELEVFQAVLRWGKSNKPDQVPTEGGGESKGDDGEDVAAAMRDITMREFLDELMELVRFPTMSADVIEDEVEPTEAVRPELILEAYRQHARPPDRRKADANPRLLPRKGAVRRVVDTSKGRVLPYVEEDDTNGVIYYIGTNGGSKPWSNPSLDGRITTTRSSEGTGNAADITGRENKKCYTDGKPESWWCVDLGEGRSLVPSRYVLRHGSKMATNQIRNWVFEGSADNSRFDVLSTHTNDETLRGSGFASASWPVSGTETPYRYFRVRQTGPNSTGDDFLVLCGIELYGTLYSP